MAFGNVVDSKTGKGDAPFVFYQVGDEERRMRWPNGMRFPPGLALVFWAQH